MKTRSILKTCLFATILLVSPYLLLAQEEQIVSWTLEDADQVTIHVTKVSSATFN